MSPTIATYSTELVALVSGIRIDGRGPVKTRSGHLISTYDAVSDKNYLSFTTVSITVNRKIEATSTNLRCMTPCLS
jgi:hypothetical protein